MSNSGERRLGQLCEQMFNEGYNYASFQDIGSDDILLEKPLNEGAKPNKGLYFSKLKSYNKDLGLSKSSDRNKSRSREMFVYPEWYHYVKFQDHDVKRYENKGIIFAKIDEKKLRKLEDIKPIKPMGFDCFSLVPLYNWADVGDKCGIIVEGNSDIGNNGWDIPQCVVWNTSCLDKVKIFKNTGKRVTYKEVNCEIKNSDIGEQIKNLLGDFAKKLNFLKL